MKAEDIYFFVWGCQLLCIVQLQFRLFTSTPPQCCAQNLQRGIRYYPAAFELNEFYSAETSYTITELIVYNVQHAFLVARSAC